LQRVANSDELIRRPLRVRLFSTAQSAARALARDVAKGLRANPRLVLGLPTGHTPIPFYQELAALSRRHRLDFSRSTTFNLDEFLGISPDDPRSYRAFMNEHLFDHVNLPPRRIQFLNGAVRDVAAECERYERAIAAAGGIDLQVLGLGANGHIGFNEPGDALIARTHRTRLTAATRRANAAWFGRDAAAVPREGLSMGVATILHARRIVLLATGAAKARCVERMVRGPITPRVPASLLQVHRHVEVWVDQAAARRLLALRSRSG
jgi:glucosamine-6-phosphate deaminase